MVFDIQSLFIERNLNTLCVRNAEFLVFKTYGKSTCIVQLIQES